MQVDEELTLTLTAGDCGVILAQMSEGPYRIVAPVIEKLRAQIAAIDPTVFAPPQLVATAPRVNGVARE